MKMVPGHYTDGLTGQKRAITWCVRGGMIEIHGVQGATEGIRYWPCFLTESISGNIGLAGKHQVLRCQRYDSERLILDHPDAVALAVEKKLVKKPKSKRPYWVLASMALAIGIISFWLMLLPAVWTPAAVSMIPESWDQKIGEYFWPSLVEKDKICHGARGQKILDGWAKELSKDMDGEVRPEVFVVDDKIANAFALMGGRIVIYRGLLEEAETPEEVAGILAHEIGHLHHRHSMHAMVKTLSMSALFTLAIGDVGGVMAIVGEGSKYLLQMSYSRGNEAEADAYATKVLGENNISPNGMADFMRRHEAESEDGMSLEIMHSHPLPEKRKKVFEDPKALKRYKKISPRKLKILQGMCGS